MLEKGLRLKLLYVSLISVVSKVIEKLVNNRIVDHLDQHGIFSDFQYEFRSFWSTAVLLTVVSDRIARAFIRSGATQAAALDTSKAFNSVWHTCFLHKCKSFRLDIWPYFFFSQLARWLWVVLDGKYSQEYPVNAGVPQGAILGLALFLLYITDPPDDICNILAMLMIHYSLLQVW